VKLPARTLVLHAGALGDSVLVWPLLRALARGGCTVTFAAATEKAQLAADHLPLTPRSLDADLFTRLWRGPSAITSADVDPTLECVISFLTDDHADWLAAARRAWPAAELIAVGPPGAASRREIWQRFDVTNLGSVAPRAAAVGPIVAHLGAGSSTKRWPIDRWSALIQHLRAAGHQVDVILGEVEAERFTPAERAAAASLAARPLTNLANLARVLLTARAFIAADTGPAHLAAQLATPTLALFGPTDPLLWRPLGPSVHLLAPTAPMSMDWLTVAAVRSAVGELLDPPPAPSPPPRGP